MLAGQRAGSPFHTPKSARAPRLLPPQLSSIRPSGRRILRPGRPAPAAAPAPPETKAQRVARSLRPAPEPLAPLSLCSLGPRARRYSRGTGTPRLRGSWALGVQGARPRPGGAGGGAGTFTRHLPDDPSTASNPSSHFLPLGRQRKLRKVGLLRRLPARDFPLGARGSLEVFLVERRGRRTPEETLARSFGKDRPWNANQAGPHT